MKLISFKVFSILFIALALNDSFADSIRSERPRYILLDDRTKILDRLFIDEYTPVIDIRAQISSGLKDLIGDIKTISENSDSSAEKQVDIINILNENLNSEKYADVNIRAALPIREIKSGKMSYYPEIFYRKNIGASLSVNSGTNSNPEMQAYAKIDDQVGVNVQFLRNSVFGKLGLYQLSRADLESSTTAVEYAAGKDVIDTDSLKNPQKSLAIDLKYGQKKENYHYFIEIEEIKIKKMNDNESIYGHTPLIHLNYTHFPMANNKKTKIHGGVHFREKYNIDDGIYVGGLYAIERFPFNVKGQLDFQFLYLGFNANFFGAHFEYGLKLPHANKQGGVWVPKMHYLRFNLQI